MSLDRTDFLARADQMTARSARAIIAFTTAVIHTRTVDEVLWLLTDETIADLGFEDCVVYIVDEERNRLVQKAAYGNKKAGPKEILEPIELELGEGITGRCAVEQKPILVNDVREDDSYVVDDVARLSELAVPILSGGRTIGVIDSEHADPGFFTDQHLATLRALSSIITTKFENERALRDLRESEARLRHLANHDSLSGLPNRHSFVTQVEAAAERFAQGEIRSLGVLLMDLDRFKLINDAYGHAAGDELIVQVGRRLRAVLPDDVLLARLSGDEFAMLFPDRAEGESAAICDLILQCLSSRVSLVTADVSVSASIGVAVASPEVCSAGALMRLADGAMYKAKARGRGCYVLDRGGDEVAVLSDLNLETAIAGALAEDEFEVYLQPIVDLETREIHSFESLIRWNHPKVGMIRPDLFIDFAERSGQVRDIDLYMLRKVGCIVRDLRQRYGRVIPISVNVSASLLTRAQWLDDETVGACSHGLNIEVTERGLVADVSAAAATLERLRERGAQVFIDDFGTGYSSLRYLHELPLDVIKIDRSFVASLASSEKSRSLVSLLVSLARSMDVQMLAEGIEDQEQIRILKELGVPMGQGYFFSRPVPVHQARELLESGQPLGGQD